MSQYWNPLIDMASLQGTVAIVTGGNSGIGLSMFKLLARRGAKVYFTTRSEAKAHRAREILQAENPEIKQENIEWLQLDLADLRSITTAANQLKMKENKVHILINNAGAATSATELVSYGWEHHMTVNFLGPFLFINRILPLLKNSQTGQDADVRIISLSSSAQSTMLPNNFKFQFDSPNAFSAPVPSYPWQWRYLGRFIFGFDMIRYSVSKAATTILAQELQRRMDEQDLNIISVAVHPGEVATEGVLTINRAPLRLIARLSFLTPDQGAVTPLFAATAKEVRQAPEKYKGKFILPGGNVGVPNPVTQDERQVNGLWENATKEINMQLSANNLPLLESW